MTSSKVPRLLQQQPGREGDDAQWRAQQQQHGGHWDGNRGEGWGAGQWQASTTAGAPRQAGDEPHPQPQPPHHPPNKGDLPDPTEAPKPNKEREVGDLERSERETHGQAQ